MATGNSFGLVLCGGNSTRMGTPKALLTYYDKPQCYHMYHLLEEICDQTFLSCSPAQIGTLDDGHQTLADLAEIGRIGPMAGLLTAFRQFPDKDFLVIGCDYPLLTKTEILEFMAQRRLGNIASAFYNQEDGVYDPLLAWYSGRAAIVLEEMVNRREYSLQSFLKAIDATRYNPKNPAVMVSADTPEGVQWAKDQINKQQIINV